ncbi:tRNA uridine-5-carboxymethylaminomethyl(34) synthesis GTPase MnmE, partial [bacterium]|nr:tRNA uridine-5-carboxymethylaminomethyl(34) synthesis GTPase MnmE [bacterium]
MDEPIVAIATSVGVSALNIIKLSGIDCIKIINNIFKGKDLEKVDSNTINYGYIIDGDKKIDEVLVSIFRAPKTYTREDVVEINCHGGIVSTNKILDLILSKGVRLAEPGEFLKRAFLNGRVDLVEAEAIQDLILAKTDEARKLSMNQIEGTTSKLINKLRDNIMEVSANIEVNIDYPEYEDAV